MPAVGASVDAVATPVEPILYAIAFMIQPALDAIALAIQMRGGFLMAMCFVPIGTPVQAIVNAFAAIVEALVNALPAVVEAIIDAIATILGE